MCRYGFKLYKSHFACFHCRKAFKKTALEDWASHNQLGSALHDIFKVFGSDNRRTRVEEKFGITYEQIEKQYLEAVSVCPECGNRMAAMGLDFKAPKKSDREAWTIIRNLYEHGFAFRGCGCYVGYEPPRKVREVPRWLAEQNDKFCKSEGERLLAAIREKSF